MVFQAVLLYGSETWVTTLYMEGVLVVFHHRVGLRMTARQPWRRRYGRGLYPLWRK